MEINACNTTHRFAVEASDLCSTQSANYILVDYFVMRVETNYTAVPSSELPW